MNCHYSNNNKNNKIKNLQIKVKIIRKERYIHINNLKTYWYKYPNIKNSELENNFKYYSFTEFETMPAISINAVSKDIKALKNILDDPDAEIVINSSGTPSEELVEQIYLSIKEMGYIK